VSTEPAELIVGRVLDVRDHPGARGPSFLLRLDLGPRGEREAQMEPGSYKRDELVGALVVVSVADAAIVLAARSHTAGPVPIQPAQPVEPGTVVA
jgi:tRNA-binding EMAP/Myf-like protein